MPAPGADCLEDPLFRPSLRSAFAQSHFPPPEAYAVTPLGGGSINRACRLSAASGDFFCKWNPGAPCDMFPREKQGLEALAATKTLAVPAVIGVCPGGDGFLPMLVLQYLRPAAATPESWRRLGRGLAEMHRSPAQPAAQGRFGFPADNYCGSTPQSNAWNPDWAAFYAERRIGALAARLRKKGVLPKSLARDLDTLESRLPELLAHRPVPALIHGDLWSGNVLFTEAGPALVDPAAYYGDREAELGMMTLFGGIPPVVFETYREAWPLPEGWRERQPLYQLYHVLNHFLLFGGVYGGKAQAMVRMFI